MDRTPTKKPGITAVTTGNVVLDGWIKQVVELHEVEDGIRGRDPLDAKPSMRDLVALGLVIPMRRGQRFKDGFGTGLPGFSVPPPPDLDYSLPPAPSNVIVVGGFTTIFVQWDRVEIPFFSHAEIWRSGEDNLGTAVPIGTTVSSFYPDNVIEDPGADYFYWVRFIKNVAGVVLVGPYNATAGTEGTSAEDPDFILEQLIGKIKDTHLFSTLKTRIDLVDAAEGIIGSVNQRIAAARSELLGSINDLGVAVAADILTEQTARIAGDEAIAEDVTILYATSASNTAAIATEATTRANADSALSSLITLVQADVAENAAAILAEQIARADEDEALASDITDLFAEVDDNAAAIANEQTVRATADSALSTTITSLSATVAGQGTSIANNSAAINTEAIARASADSALASITTALSTTVAGNTASIVEVSTVVDGLSAEYTLRLDVNGYVVGFGIYNEGPGESGFLVNIDSFAVGTPGESNELPFIIAPVDGVTKIALNADTFIPDATITNAKIDTVAAEKLFVVSGTIADAIIGSAHITNAMIDDLDATKLYVDSGTIAAAIIGSAHINTAMIQDLAVTTLKIGNNAVTVPSTVTTTSSVTTTTFNTWYEVNSLTVDYGSLTPTGVLVLATVNLTFSSGTGEVIYEIKISHNGSDYGLVQVSAPSGYALSLVTMAGIVPTSGSNTFTVHVRRIFGGTIHAGGSRSMVALGVRK